MASGSAATVAQESAEGSSQKADNAPVTGSIRHLHSSGACKRGT
jgi:hypothetical protein